MISGKKALKFLRDTVVVILIAVLISFLVKTFLLRSFFIPSGSMENTLQVDDRVLVNKLVPSPVGVERGDVIVFKDPGGWLNIPAYRHSSEFEKVMAFIGLAPDGESDYLIKRVIGLPGDRVQCCDASGRMTVNGRPLDETYIVRPQGEMRASGLAFDVTVPAKSYWVMGDNRYASKDSRYNQDQPGKGFIPADNVVGRAFVLNFPFSRFTILGNYPEVFKEVPAPAEPANP